jgi:hypothetical protein
MCYTDTKKKEIVADNGIIKDNDDVLKVVATFSRLGFV